MSTNKDFGAFELRQKIGSGGMASVYLGVQKALDRQVVLKILYPHLAEDAKLVQRFEREARLAARLRHENIVQVIDCGRHDDLSYIAMEFVEGLDLKQWMTNHGHPPLEMALLILRDVCRGIEHAHLHKVVHRDIKPANVMLTPDGSIKIMDFGLARRGEETSTMTVAGAVMGTPAYMSPEQATGDAVDERSDIFSAGVMGYELLGGERPFPGDSYSSVLRAIISVEPPPLEQLNPLVPAEVTNIIHKMLVKDVSKRCASIGEVRGDLETVIEQMGLHRGRDLLREYAQEPARVTELLRKRRLTRHFDQGLAFEKLGPDNLDDAIREFGRVLFIDSDHKEARERRKALEREREKRNLAAAKAVDDDKTMLFPPTGVPGVSFPPPSATAPSPSARPAPPPPPPPRREPPRETSREAPRPARSGGKVTADDARRNLVIAGAALGVILIAGIVFAFRPRPAPTGSVAVAGPDSSSSSSTAPPPEPAKPQTVPTPAPVVAEVGQLLVTTRPTGAKILIDGVVQTRGSGATLEGIPAGERRVRVQKEGYAPQEKAITIKPGEPAKLSFALEPSADATGTLEIRVQPFATFYVDDKPVQSNVAFIRVSLKAGPHTVRAVHPAFEPKVWTNVRISPNTTAKLSHSFLGKIRVSSGGIWGYVWIDGKDTGKTTPCELSDVMPGDHKVNLVRQGFTIENGSQTVVVRQGETTPIEFRLRQN